MRVMMSTPPVLGTPVEAQPIMARMAELEAAHMMEQTEPAGSSTMYGHLRRMLSIPRQLVWIDGPLCRKPACDAALADSLRAFDAMTIDDLAALQTAR
jgi:hypothetical protein